MKYLQPSFTVPAAPEKVTACEKCAYGTGNHADSCAFQYYVSTTELWYGDPRLNADRSTPNIAVDKGIPFGLY